MRVQLIRKLAERINGIDLSGRIPGDILELSDRDAASLVAEGWAVPEGSDVVRAPNPPVASFGMSKSRSRSRSEAFELIHEIATGWKR